MYLKSVSWRRHFVASAGLMIYLLLVMGCAAPPAPGFVIVREAAPPSGYQAAILEVRADVVPLGFQANEGIGAGAAIVGGLGATAQGVAAPVVNALPF